MARYRIHRAHSHPPRARRLARGSAASPPGPGPRRPVRGRRRAPLVPGPGADAAPSARPRRGRARPQHRGRKLEPGGPQGALRHPVSGETLHVDLLRVRLDQKIESTVVLELTGTEDAPGIREGGVLEHVTRELDDRSAAERHSGLADARRLRDADRRHADPQRGPSAGRGRAGRRPGDRRRHPHPAAPPGGVEPTRSRRRPRSSARTRGGRRRDPATAAPRRRPSPTPSSPALRCRCRDAVAELPSTG